MSGEGVGDVGSLFLPISKTWPSLVTGKSVTSKCFRRNRIDIECGHFSVIIVGLSNASVRGHVSKAQTAMIT